MGFADGLKRLGGLLSPIAPTLGRLALSAVPGGSVAAQVIDSVKKATGSASDDPDELANAVADATPEQAAAIRAADQQHELEMTKLALRHYQTDQRDRADARRMAIKNKNRGVFYFGVGIVASSVAVFVYFGALLAGRGDQVPDLAAHFIASGIGYLIAASQTVISFYWGSSAGGEDVAASMTDQFNGRK